MGMRIRAAVVAAVVAVGTVSPAALAGKSSGAAARPTVVVAVADTGVNPYHKAFYRPQNTAHPCTWVKGFTDCSVPALRLSVGKHKTVQEAFEADRAVWASVKEHRWYWIPKTNIIGAVCDSAVGGGAGGRALAHGGPSACILDESYHGTGTASAVLSEAPDALLLVHEGDMGANDMPSAPVTPDVQSHSWGYPVPMPLQAARPVHESACKVGNAGPRTLVFLAAGNESPMPSVADCWRSRPEVQVVGGGYPGYVQANSWTMYDFASWYCRPGASHESVRDSTRNCGTSFAAPTAAGAAAAALLRVRQHDRYSGRSTRDLVSPSVTREKFVEALRSAATYAPRTKFPEAVPCTNPTAPCFGLRSAGVLPLPQQAPHVFWGYGWLDSTVSDAVVACALGRSCPRKPDAATTWNEHRQQVRAALSLNAVVPTPDDAGSGRDAGEDLETSVPVRPGARYAGHVGAGTDWGDSYAFHGKAGQRLTVTGSASSAPAGAEACWVLWGPGETRMTPTSGGNVFSCEHGAKPPTGVTLEEDGVYRVQYRTHLPHDYTFSIALTAR